MATQGPVKLTTETALASSDAAASNVAVGQAQVALAKETAGPSSIADRDIYPARVFTKDLHLETNLTVGSGVQLTDGCIAANHLATDHALITESLQVGGAVITSEKISVENLSSLSANLGNINAGSIAIGAGGVSIGSGSSGIGIYGNKIACVAGGTTTVLIDGDSGVLTCTKINLTADSSSVLDLSDAGGNVVLADTVIVGTSSLGGMKNDTAAARQEARDALEAAATAQETADGEIIGFYQTSAPTSGMKFGDIWIDTDYYGFPTVDAIYRYQDINGKSQGTLAWRSARDDAVGKAYLLAYTAETTADGKIKTFYSASTPTADGVGDLWVETDNNNKLYRWSGSSWQSVRDGTIAAAQSTADNAYSEAISAGATASDAYYLADAAIKPGGGVQVNSQKYITVIDMASGLTIRSSSSTERTQITSNGLAIYNTLGNLTVQLDHVHGVYVNNFSATPGYPERVTVAYNSTDKGYIWAVANGMQVRSPDGNSIIHLSSSGRTITLTAPNGVYLAGSGGLRAIHKSYTGDSKADTIFSFYAAASSGGSPTVKHTVTFQDGLITSWATS